MTISPHVVVFFESVPTDMGTLLLNLAAAAWKYERRTTLLVDADPARRLTRAAKINPRFLPRTEDVHDLEDYFEAAERLEASPSLAPWRLSDRARRLIPNRGNVLGAHARALATVLSTGGALNLGEHLGDLLYPLEAGVHLSLILAPPPGSGLGAFLGAHANQIVLVGDSFTEMKLVLSDIDRFCLAAYPSGPDTILPVLRGGVPTRIRSFPPGSPERLPPIYVDDFGSPQQALQMLRLLQ
jgi:hypothetical protein